MDLYNGEIIAYTVGGTQDTSFILDTLAQLKQLPEVSPTVIGRSRHAHMCTNGLNRHCSF
ncbi:hypothetical protein [Lysinibacillus parviboronicapiens]